MLHIVDSASYSMLATIDFGVAALIGCFGGYQFRTRRRVLVADGAGVFRNPWATIRLSLIFLLSGVSDLGSAAGNYAVALAGRIGAIAIVFLVLALLAPQLMKRIRRQHPRRRSPRPPERKAEVRDAFSEQLGESA